MVATGFTVKIGIEDLATFMPINNTFCKTAGHNWRREAPYWNGVLIQLGEHETHGDEQFVRGEIKRHFDRRKMDVFHKDEAVTFWKNEQRKVEVTDLRLTKDDIKSHTFWINVFPINTKLLPPLPQEHPARKQRGESSKSSSPEEEHQTEQQRGQPMSVGDLKELNLVDPVASMDRFFHPFRGGITLWHDVGEGFDLEARMTAHRYEPEAPHGTHNEYTFKLTGGPYRLEIYKNGDKFKEELWEKPFWKDIGEILIRADDDTAAGHGHGKHNRGGGGGG